LFFPGHSGNSFGLDSVSFAFIATLSSEKKISLDATSKAFAWKHYSDPSISSFPKLLIIHSGLFPPISSPTKEQMRKEGAQILERIE
jgi:hypothetical protein